MYVITGATGFLGLVLVKKMLEQNLKPIKVLVRSESSTDLFKGLDVIVKVGSLDNDIFLNNEINNEDIVIHLAALVKIGNVNKKEMLHTNTTVTKLIADISSNKNVKKFIYVSSTSALYDNSLEIINPYSFNYKKAIGYYAKTKVLSSKYVNSLIEDNKLNGIIIYPSLIIGPYDYRISSISNVIINFFNKNYQLYIKGSYTFIDVRDLADIIIKSFSENINGNSYLATNNSLTIKEMFELFNTYKKRRSKLIKIPLLLVKIFIPFVLIYYKLFNKEPMFTNESVRIINQSIKFNNIKTKNDLNIEFRSVEESFKDMISFFEEEGKLNGKIK